MKTRTKRFLQRLFGLENYLLLFAIFRVCASRIDRREAGLFQFIRLLPDHPLVLDVGANLGVTATIIQQQTNASRVVAFEPIPVNLRTLRGLFKLFGVCASVVPCAVGNSSTPIEMILPEEDGVFLHGLGHVKQFGATPEDGALVQANMIKLDDSSHLWGKAKIDGIKLDVENCESEVLLGAKRLLQRDQPVIYCELWDNDNRRQSLEIARELGYSINVLWLGKLVPFEIDVHSVDNFFLLPRAVASPER